MFEKTYLQLLILFGIWYQGIIGSFADETFNNSSNFHVRQKRVVSNVPGEDKKVTINNTPYVVAVKHKLRISCVGTILSHYAVITAAKCVEMTPNEYQISSNTSRSNHAPNHNVMDIRRHLAISLLTVNPPFMYGFNSRNIQLNVEPLLPGAIGRVSGWGFDWRSINRGTIYPTCLRSIEVPIMIHQDCVNIYRQHNVTISDAEVCTYDRYKHCGHSDFGAPLIIDGHLAGVYIWTGPYKSMRHDPRFPDVFAILQHSTYNQWIRTNLQQIGV